MRSEEEIRKVFHELGEQSDDPTAPNPRSPAELPVNAWEGDTFKYGYLIGKLVALEWVLGRSSTSLKSHYDFEDYTQEDKLETEDFREWAKKLKKLPEVE
jgi:hypothetical protein